MSAASTDIVYARRALRRVNTECMLRLDKRVSDNAVSLRVDTKQDLYRVRKGFLVLSVERKPLSKTRKERKEKVYKLEIAPKFCSQLALPEARALKPSHTK